MEQISTLGYCWAHMAHWFDRIDIGVDLCWAGLQWVSIQLPLGSTGSGVDLGDLGT